MLLALTCAIAEPYIYSGPPIEFLIKKNPKTCPTNATSFYVDDIGDGSEYKIIPCLLYTSDAADE